MQIVVRADVQIEPHVLFRWCVDELVETKDEFVRRRNRQAVGRELELGHLEAFAAHRTDAIAARQQVGSAAAEKEHAVVLRPRPGDEGRHRFAVRRG